jgi:hypothetical protein
VKIAVAIREVRDAEVQLADALGRIGERHRADHDVFHLSRTLIGVHGANLEALEPFGERYGTNVEPAEAEAGGGPLAQAREKASELIGRRPEAGLLLLRDLWTVTRLRAAAPQVLAG